MTDAEKKIIELLNKMVEITTKTTEQLKATIWVAKNYIFKNTRNEKE